MGYATTLVDREAHGEATAGEIVTLAMEGAKSSIRNNCHYFQNKFEGNNRSDSSSNGRK